MRHSCLHAWQGYIFCIFVTFLLLTGHASAGERYLQTYQTHNRPAQELTPMIQPMLATPSTVSASGFNLFVKATKEEHADVQKILAASDAALKSLLVTVQRGYVAEIDENSLQATADIPVGNKTRIISGTPSEKNTIQVRASHSVSTDGGQVTQQIRVVEGQQAFIESGVEVPITTEQKIAVFTQGSYLSKRNEYKPVVSGFYVVPHVRGELVLLDIVSQVQNIENNKTINTQKLLTTVQGKLGSWIPLGEIIATSNTSDQRLIASTLGTQSQSNNLRIKVTVAP